MEPKVKLRDITELTTLAIFLVILGHAITADSGIYIETKVAINFIRRFIYSFHMPLFMFISGYIFSHTNILSPQIDYPHFMAKKFKRLLVPYLIISSIAFFPKAVLSRFAVRPVYFNLNSYVKGIIYPVDNHIKFYWFLPTLFMIFAITPLLFRILKAQKPVSILLTTGIFILLNIYGPSDVNIFGAFQVMYFLIFFWLGSLFYLHKNKFVFQRYHLCAFLFFLIALYWLNYFSLPIVAERTLRCMNLLAAICGISMSFYLIQLFIDNEIRILPWLQDYTYQIFLLHWFAQIFFRIVIFQVLNLGYWITFTCMLIGGLALPVLAAKLVYKYLPRLRLIIGG
ncbi:MAG: acyltransferase [Candidatus Omnitrophota bacterium]|nr:acyltransferase [Candidatus Omnitrophota bacterium]